MSESNFKNHLLRSTFKKLFPKGHWQCVENKFDLGIPDVNSCGDGVCVWVECKFAAAEPKRDTAKLGINFTQEQAKWITLHNRSGGRAVCILYVRKPKGYYLIDPALADAVTNKPWSLLKGGLPCYTDLKSLLKTIYHKG